MNFFEKFFGYVNDGGSLKPYSDGLGGGTFSDWRHFAWIIVIIALGFVVYFLAKKYPNIMKKIVFGLAIALFSVRFTNQVVRAIIGAEVPGWRAIPFHLCTISTFLLPLCIVFNWKKIKMPVAILGMMGGIITILINDYFDNRFMTFSSWEGICAHSLLILLTISMIGYGEISLHFKDFYKVIVLVLVYMAWATLGNEVFFKEYNTNYMYLKRNELPGDIGGKYYFLIYAAIFLVMEAIIFAIPTICRKVKAKKTIA